MRVSRNLYFVKKKYLIDIGKDKGRIREADVECIRILKQKVFLFSKFRENQKETIGNALRAPPMPHA
jgi:hypothetical protein